MISYRLTEKYSQKSFVLQKVGRIGNDGPGRT